MDIDVDVDSEKVTARLKGMTERINLLEPWWNEAAQSLKKYIAANFSSQGLLVGGWAPLSAKYAAWKAVTTPAPILVRTGALQAAALEPEVSIIGPFQRRYKADIDIAGFHQYGTRKMPKRQFMFVNEEYAQEMAIKLARYVAGDRATDEV